MPPIDRSGGAVRHKTGAQWTHRIPLDAIHSLNATKVPGSGPDWNSDPPCNLMDLLSRDPVCNLMGR